MLNASKNKTDPLKPPPPKKSEPKTNIQNTETSFPLP